jgi:hypothetical protein
MGAMLNLTQDGGNISDEEANSWDEDLTDSDDSGKDDYDDEDYDEETSHLLINQDPTIG